MDTLPLTPLSLEFPIMYGSFDEDTKRALALL